MVKPLTPKEAKQAKLDIIPDFVIEAFNTCIVKNMDSYGFSSFKQKDVINIIIQSASENNGFSESDIFNNKWLDIEPLYRNLGWQVRYDKPGYNEDYDAFFEFSEKSL